jgi:FkbM family methyltransferase
MLKTYSQNKEDLFILNYFGKFKGRLLEIGANDGVTLSNSKLLIDNGWNGVLLEPGLIYQSLNKLYPDGCVNVCAINTGIGLKNDIVTFYESGAHIKNGSDRGLVSTTDYNETLKWRKSGVPFKETKIRLITYAELLKQTNNPTFDFISIDAEGMDWEILQQIDLANTKCLCIEWNSDTDLYRLFTDYCKGFKVAVKNAENLIFTR